jgi:hypothetical protein
LATRQIVAQASGEIDLFGVTLEFSSEGATIAAVAFDGPDIDLYKVSGAGPAG